MQTRGKNTYALKSFGGASSPVENSELRNLLEKCYPESEFLTPFVDELAKKIDDRWIYANLRPLLWRDVESSLNKAGNAARKLMEALTEIEAANNRKGVDLIHLLERRHGPTPYRFLLMMQQDLREKHFTPYTPAKGNKSWVRRLKEFLHANELKTTMSENSEFHRLLLGLQEKYNIITPDVETYTPGAFFETVRKWLR